jgi:hypothetical protein
MVKNKRCLFVHSPFSVDKYYIGEVKYNVPVILGSLFHAQGKFKG